MNLPEYINKIGDIAFAEKFNVSVRTAASYRLEERLPRPKLAEKIIAKSPVTWAGIYCSKRAN